jgi:hypothetical protein
MQPEKHLANFFVAVKERFIAYCSCSEVAKLFTFLMSPYSLTGTSNNMQNCTYFRDKSRWGSVKLSVVLKGGRSYHIA